MRNSMERGMAMMKNRGHIVSEEMVQQMHNMRKDGMTCRQIAAELHLSKSTVSRHTRNMQVVKKTELEHLRDLMQAAKSYRKRTDTLYDVRIYYIRKRPDLVIHTQLDHRPTYTDMMLLCKLHGLDAVDFADDHGTKIDDPVYHGTVYMPQSRTYPLARFTIKRLRGEVYLEDFFR